MAFVISFALKSVMIGLEVFLGGFVLLLGVSPFPFPCCFSKRLSAVFASISTGARAQLTLRLLSHHGHASIDTLSSFSRSVNQHTR